MGKNKLLPEEYHEFKSIKVLEKFLREYESKFLKNIDCFFL